jgi:hypothetical protein
MEMSGQLHIPAASLWGKSPQYPLHRKLSGPEKWFACGEKEIKTYHCPFWELNPSCPAHSLVSTLTIWHRILKIYFIINLDNI